MTSLAGGFVVKKALLWVRFASYLGGMFLHKNASASMVICTSCTHPIRQEAQTNHTSAPGTADTKDWGFCENPGIDVDKRDSLTAFLQ